MNGELYPGEFEAMEHNGRMDALEQEPCENAISRQAVIDAFHTWFRDGFDEDKWWNSTHVLAAIEGIPSVHQKHKWETCFECPLSHGCPKIKGCTNEQAIEYASKIPNDCPLSAQLKRKTDEDAISRQAVEEIINNIRDCISVEGYWVFLERLKKLPPVNPLSKDYNTIYYTPQPKTGHWIQTNEFFINQDGQFIYKFICSECKSLSYFRKSNKKAIGANVCPNCGVKMVEQESEG